MSYTSGIKVAGSCNYYLDSPLPFNQVTDQKVTDDVAQTSAASSHPPSHCRSPVFSFKC